jgi:hypothetical protein
LNEDLERGIDETRPYRRVSDPCCGGSCGVVAAVPEVAAEYDLDLQLLDRTSG